MLLKYTHFPIVGIIMFYESMQERLNLLTRKDSVFFPTGLAPRGFMRESYALSSRADGRGSSQQFFDLRDDDAISSPSRAHEVGKERARAEEGDNISLQRKMDELNEKIERLTALVTAQQYCNSSETQEDTR
jgi:dynactin complex subunit